MKQISNPLELANMFAKIYCVDNQMPIVRLKPLNVSQYCYNLAMIQEHAIEDYLLLTIAEYLIQDYEQKEQELL